MARLLHRAALVAAFTGAAGCAPTFYNTNLHNHSSACTTTSDSTQMQKRVPKLAASLDILRQLPQVGEPVYGSVTEGVIEIQSCIFRVRKNEPSINEYQNRYVIVASNTGTRIAAHEYFHAAQDNDLYTVLDQRTAAITGMTKEATAVSYEIALMREAHDLGMQLIPEEIPGQAWDPKNIELFNAAYDTIWSKTEGLEPKLRQAKSLEAGGKAVALSLLKGNDPKWHKHYVDNVIPRNIKAYVANDGREKQPGYDYLRSSILRDIGYVSDNINFTPDEFSSIDAEKYINEAYVKFGFKEQKLKPPKNRP